MKIRDKINLNLQGLIEEGPINIVAFGDSVTQGCGDFGKVNYETVYFNRLKKMITAYRNFVPVNVINAGIGGITAEQSLGRMEKQVFGVNPDLIIICFGLNDVNGTLESYLSALSEMFDRCNEKNIETIFLTPNMLNTSVTERIKTTRYASYAVKTAEMQNGGRMDKYIYSAVDLAKSKNIIVCDCYSKWKEMSKKEDITKYLANDINHPKEEMHELFAKELFKCIIPDVKPPEILSDGMYKG